MKPSIKTILITGGCLIMIILLIVMQTFLDSDDVMHIQHSVSINKKLIFSYVSSLNVTTDKLSALMIIWNMIVTIMPIIAALIGGWFILKSIKDNSKEIRKLELEKRKNEANNFAETEWWIFSLRIERLYHTLSLALMGGTTWGKLEIDIMKSLIERSAGIDDNMRRKLSFIMLYEIIYIIYRHMENNEMQKAIAFIIDKSDYMLDRISSTNIINEENTTAALQMKILRCYKIVTDNMLNINMISEKYPKIPKYLKGNIVTAYRSKNISDTENMISELEETIEKGKYGDNAVTVINMAIELLRAGMEIWVAKEEIMKVKNIAAFESESVSMD